MNFSRSVRNPLAPEVAATATIRRLMMDFDSVRVFSATMIADRLALGDKVTAWLAENATLEIADMVVTQSSDSRFHCIAITVFYRSA